ENEKIAKKFNEIEIKILSILNFKDLFEVLLSEIKQKFKVPYVWISMIEKSEISSLIQSIETSNVLNKYLNIIRKETFLELVDNNTKPLLINENLKPYFKLLPQDIKFFIKSMAIAPIFLDGEIIGSLNQADFSRIRYQPGIDTSLLEQLSIKVSICLSNVTAHEKLRFLTFHDPHTGLLNRRVLKTVLRREFNRAKFYSNVLSVVSLDISSSDNFNDFEPDDVSYSIVKYVAEKLIKMVRDSDVVVGFTENKFVLILPETSADSAMNLMRRIQTYFSEHPMKYGYTTIPILMNFGLASTEDISLKDPISILLKSDQILHQIKSKE
ncbi:MAG: diguanylate cyclase, partial [Desulfobacterales bacterium]|nr:diguanylate cyclase [Desulfobacterales bacterium]